MHFFIMISFFILNVTILHFSRVAAYDENNLLEDDKKGLSSRISNLTGQLGQIPDQFKKQLPDINEGLAMIEKRCEQYGTNESFSELQDAKDVFDKCITDIVEIGELQREIEKEKQTGNLDKVFKKYCKKSSALRNCVNDFAEEVRPCLSEEEKQNMPIFTNVSEALTNFVCFKEGDRIALFIAEQGPECINSNYNNIIKNCGNFTPEAITLAMKPGDSLNSSAFPLLRLDESECEDIFKFQKCVVQNLETCPEPTPANIIDSLFKFVIKFTKCQKYQVTSSSFVSVSNTVLIITGLLCTLFRPN